MLGAPFLLIVMWKVAVANDMCSELDELGPTRARRDDQEEGNDKSHAARLVCDRSRTNGKQPLHSGVHVAEFSVAFEGLS